MRPTRQQTGCTKLSSGLATLPFSLWLPTHQPCLSWG